MTIRDMLVGKSSGTGPIPTQTYYAQNIAGGPVPKVGAAQSTSGTSLAGQFASVKPTHIVTIMLILIGAGYLLHHLSFEENVGARASAG